MGVKFNPFTSKLDVVDSPDGDFSSLDISGDITLDDGGTYTTTVQVVTPTANRTISFPDATGTVALVAGSSGQLTYNNAGAQAGVSGSTVGSSGNLTLNASSGFSGNLLDLQVNGTSKAQIDSNGRFASRYGYVYGKPQFWDSSVGDGAGLLIANTNSLALFNGSAAVLSTSNSANTGIRIASYLPLGWTSTGGHALTSVPDVALARDAAGILAQRNGTNAQTFRLYNTYTDASNYERGIFQWNSNVLEIGSESDGTGINRLVKIVTNSSVNIQAGGTNQKVFSGGLERNSSSNHITWSNSVNALTGVTSDIGIKRDQANVLAVTDGSTGTGYIKQVPVAISALPDPTDATGVGAGTRGFVNDASSTTFSAVVAVGTNDGGSTVVPVYSDGTSWRIG